MGTSSNETKYQLVDKMLKFINKKSFILVRYISGLGFMQIT